MPFPILRENHWYNKVIQRSLLTLDQELQKLLKSKAIMKNKEDIERHDQRVYHKWSLILENYHCLEGPLKQTLDRLIGEYLTKALSTWNGTQAYVL